jgi:hypothetical protein
MFTTDVISEIANAARDLGVEPAALLAVAEVESGDTAFAMIGGRREPLIRFEGHYFDRRLSEKNRAIAREKGLSAPVAGAIANPKTQAARWRMLNQAVAIDARAAYESVSWGLGQVMGAHWLWLGYESVEALVAEARSGVAGQVRLMVLYIEKAGLAKALAGHDWAGFARGYNGPAFGKNGYDRKLASAYKNYAQAAGPAPLRRGSKGANVERLQRSLSGLGYPLAVDGIFGPATARMVKRFQSDHALVADGIAGPKTMAKLEALQNSGAAPQNTGKPGLWASLTGWLARIFGAS